MGDQSTPFFLKGTDGPKSSPTVSTDSTAKTVRESTRKKFPEDAPIRAAKAREEEIPMEISQSKLTAVLGPIGLKALSYEQLAELRNMSVSEFEKHVNSTIGTKKMNLYGEGKLDAPEEIRNAFILDYHGYLMDLGPECPLTWELYDMVRRFKRGFTGSPAARADKQNPMQVREINQNPQFAAYQAAIMEEMKKRGAANPPAYRLDETRMIPKSSLDPKIIARNEYMTDALYPSDRKQLPISDSLTDIKLLNLKNKSTPEDIREFLDSSIGKDESVTNPANWSDWSEEQQMAYFKEVMVNPNGTPRMLGQYVPLTRAMYARVRSIANSELERHPLVWKNPQFAVYQEELNKLIKARGLSAELRPDEREYVKRTTVWRDGV